MFFSISKIGWFFLTPSNLMLMALTLGVLLLFTSAWRLGRRLVLASLVLLFVAGILPLGYLLLLPLEERFAQWPQAARSPTGIIVLGGASETPVTLARGQLSLNESAERMMEGAMLARRYPAAKLVFTGGDGGWLGGIGNESDDAESFFVKLGVPRSQLVLERNSRNTYENAGLVAKAVQPKPGEVWLLVTSAWHMPRAMGCFRRAGLTVTPYPVDYRTRGWDDSMRPFGAVSEGLRRTDMAVREWLGLLVYYFAGYTDRIFPGA